MKITNGIQKKIPSIKCPMLYCSSRLMSSGEVQDHLLLIHNAMITCSYVNCSEKFKTNKDLNHHVLMDHPFQDKGEEKLSEERQGFMEKADREIEQISKPIERKLIYKGWEICCNSMVDALLNDNVVGTSGGNKILLYMKDVTEHLNYCPWCRVKI